MPILDNQYEDITDPQQRIEFRAQLQALLRQHPRDDNPMISVLKGQNEASLTKLAVAINSILPQNMPSKNKQIFEQILSNVNSILSKKQLDAAVFEVYNTVLSRVVDSDSDNSIVSSLDSDKKRSNITKNDVAYTKQTQTLFHNKLQSHEWSSYEVGSLTTITPRSFDDFVSLCINSHSATINNIIEEVYAPCRSKNSRTLYAAQKGNVIFIDKELLQRHTQNPQQVKEKIFAQKEQVITELKQSIRLSIQKCSSDETQQQGRDMLERLSHLINSAEKLIDAVKETETYTTTVSTKIELFTQKDKISYPNR